MNRQNEKRKHSASADGWQAETHRPASRHLERTSRKHFINISSLSVVWFEPKTSGLMLRSVKRGSCPPVSLSLSPSVCLPLSGQYKKLHLSHCNHPPYLSGSPQPGSRRTGPGAAEHQMPRSTVLPWQLRLLLMWIKSHGSSCERNWSRLSPPDNRGLDDAWSLRQELNLPWCRSQINKTGKQRRESAAPLIWFGCRMFLAFHTQVILGIFFLF